MHEADLSMIKDVERRAVRKWEKKNNMKIFVRALRKWEKKNNMKSFVADLSMIKDVERFDWQSRWADRFEYKDMIDDWWQEMLPPNEENQ